MLTLSRFSGSGRDWFEYQQMPGVPGDALQALEVSMYVMAPNAHGPTRLQAAPLDLMKRRPAPSLRHLGDPGSHHRMTALHPDAASFGRRRSGRCAVCFNRFGRRPFCFCR